MPPPNQKLTFQQARAARLAVAALFFTNGALFSNLIPRYPEIKDIFALSDSIYGLTIALFPLGAICAGPLAGAFIRRFSSARTACLGTVGIGVFLSIVGLIATWRASLGAQATGTTLATAVYILYAVMFFSGGAFDSVTDVGQNAHGLRVQKLYGRSIINSFHAAWSIGAVAGGLMGSLATSLHIPLGWHLTGSSLIFIIVGFTAYRFTLPGSDDVPERIERITDAESMTLSGRTTPGGPDIASDQAESTQTQQVRPVAVSTLVAITTLTFLSISGTLVEDAGNAWSALIMRDYLGIPGGAAGLAFVVLLFSQAIGRIVADKVIDAIGARGTSFIGGAMVLVGGVVAFVYPHVATMILAMVLAGAGCSAIVPIAMNAADNIPRMKTGSGLTIVTWLMRLAFLLSPPIMGMIVEATSLRAVLAVLAVSGALTLATAWIIAPRDRRGRLS